MLAAQLKLLRLTNQAHWLGVGGGDAVMIWTSAARLLPPPPPHQPPPSHMHVFWQNIQCILTALTVRA
jgi:hypothetical protein